MRPRQLRITPHRSPLVRLRSNFLAGLVVVLPIGLTIWLALSAIGFMDRVVMPLVPARFHPEVLFGVDAHGVGIILFLTFTILIGWIAKGFVGRSLLRLGESIVERMPVIRSIYGALKQITETIFSDSETRFDKACLVEYPRQGAWAIGFIAGPARGEVAEIGDDMQAIFVPTTPNPTSGVLIYAPRSDLRVLKMTVEDAAKLIISAGLVYPEPKSTQPVPDDAIL